MWLCMTLAHAHCNLRQHFWPVDNIWGLRTPGNSSSRGHRRFSMPGQVSELSTNRSPSFITNWCYVCQTLKDLLVFLPGLVHLRTIYLCYITQQHPFNGLFSRTTCVNRYQKGNTSLDLNEARDDGVLGWQWHQLDHMQSLNFLQTRCSFWRPTNSVKAPKDYYKCTHFCHYYYSTITHNTTAT